MILLKLSILSVIPTLGFCSISSLLEHSFSNETVPDSYSLPTSPPPPDAFIYHKNATIANFKHLVSDFLSDAQLSKCIEVSAVGMHKGKSLDDIIEDLYSRLRKNLTTQQISHLAKAQKGILSQMDDKTWKVMGSRIRRMIIYSLDPAAEQIHKFATRPSMAFALMAETINPRVVNSTKSLIRDILTTSEYDLLRKYYNPTIIKL